MLGLRLLSPNNITLQELEDIDSDLNPDEVRVELIYGGICGSDLSVLRGKIPYAAYPVRPGHELLGVVRQAGMKAEHLIGRRVVVVPNTFCGECEYCREGHTNICKEKKSMGVNVDGGFAEQIRVSSKYCISIPDDISDMRAVLIEPLAVVVHAFCKVKIARNTSIAIVGCGNEGMFAAALATSMDADVVAIDVNPEKLERVRSLGVSKTFTPDELGDQQFDVVVEAAGVRSSVEQAIQLVRPNGVCVLIGLTQEATLPVFDVVRREISLFGSIIYNFPEDFATAIQYLRNPRLKAEEIISKIVPFQSFSTAYDHALSGGFGKVLLDFRKQHID